jgi:hypothetical protein
VARDCRFENIRAIDCGDDGVSAHDDCRCRVDGLVSAGNSTGICDVGDSLTEYNRVLIHDCLGHDLYFLEYNRHAVRNSVVLSSAWRTLVVTGGPKRPDARCTLTLDNVYIRRVRGTNEVRVEKGALLDARRLTLVGLNFQATGGEVRLFDSVIAGAPQPEMTLWRHVGWQADRNQYDARFVRRDGQLYTAQTFADFQRAAGQDHHSQWHRIALRDGKPQGLPPKVGADVEMREPNGPGATPGSCHR